MRLNKGEWSELFIGLLSLKKGELNLYNSTTKIKINDISYDGKNFLSKKDINDIDLNVIKKFLCESIGVFRVPIDVINKVNFKKGSSKNKTDIILRYLLQNENFEDNFSIKSSIGGKPSLLNASRATNFRYSIKNKCGGLLELKTKNLLEKIDINDIRFEKCLSPIFCNNLKMIDSSLDVIISKILISYYKRIGNKIPELVEKTFENFNEKQQIKQRIKDFLYYSCVGMFPTKLWNGKEEIIGKLVYTQDEDLFCLHRIDINNFKDYIYNNSILDTASTSRHHFGSLFEENQQTFLDLNLLIRMR